MQNEKKITLNSTYILTYIFKLLTNAANNFQNVVSHHFQLRERCDINFLKTQNNDPLVPKYDLRSSGYKTQKGFSPQIQKE